MTVTSCLLARSALVAVEASTGRLVVDRGLLERVLALQHHFSEATVQVLGCLGHHYTGTTSFAKYVEELLSRPEEAPVFRMEPSLSMSLQQGLQRETVITISAFHVGEGLLFVLDTRGYKRSWVEPKQDWRVVATLCFLASSAGSKLSLHLVRQLANTDISLLAMAQGLMNQNSDSILPQALPSLQVVLHDMFVESALPAYRIPLSFEPQCEESEFLRGCFSEVEAFGLNAHAPSDDSPSMRMEIAVHALANLTLSELRDSVCIGSPPFGDLLTFVESLNQPQVDESELQSMASSRLNLSALAQEIVSQFVDKFSSGVEALEESSSLAKDISVIRLEDAKGLDTAGLSEAGIVDIWIDAAVLAKQDMEARLSDVRSPNHRRMLQHIVDLTLDICLADAKRLLLSTDEELVSHFQETRATLFAVGAEIQWISCMIQEYARIIDEFVAWFQQVNAYAEELKNQSIEIGDAAKQTIQQMKRDRKKQRRRLFGNILRMIASAAVGLACSILVPPALTAWGITGIANAMVTGAVSSTASGLVRGEKSKDLLKSACRGAVVAGAANIIGTVIPTTNLTGAARATAVVMKAAAEGVVGGAVNVTFSSGKFWTGFVRGVVSEASASLADTFDLQHGLATAMMSGTSAAVTAAILNEDPIEAFLQGVSIDLLNHAAHQALDRLSDPKPTEEYLLLKSTDGTEVAYVNGHYVLKLQDGQIMVVVSEAQPKYIQVVAGTAMGVADFVVDTGKGLLHVVLHPCDSAKALGHAVYHYDETAAAIVQHYRDVSDKLNDPNVTLKEKMQIATKEGLDVASIFVGGGAATKAGKVSQLKDVGQAANKMTHVNQATKWTARAETLVVTETKMVKAISRQELGVLGEQAARNLFNHNLMKNKGWVIQEFKVGGNHGFDSIAHLTTKDGKVEKIYIIESKATAKVSGGTPKPTFGNTKAGRQTSSPWIAEKLNRMYDAGGETRRMAEMIKNNLDKTDILLNVYNHSKGVNSWKHKNLLPEAKINTTVVKDNLKF